MPNKLGDGPRNFQPIKMIMREEMVLRNVEKEGVLDEGPTSY